MDTVEIDGSIGIIVAEHRLVEYRRAHALNVGDGVAAPRSGRVLMERRIMTEIGRKFAAIFVTATVVLATVAGCSDEQKTGKVVTETPEQVKVREEGTKSAMERGAYGDQYKAKPATTK